MCQNEIGLCRWWRLGEQCTQAQRPWPEGAALRPFPRVFFGAWFVCVGALVTVASAGGAGGVVLHGPCRMCLQLIDARWSAPPFLQCAPSSTAHPPHCVRQASIMTMVCRGGGGAAALMMGAWSRGGSARSRVHASTHANLVSRMCNKEDRCHRPLATWTPIWGCVNAHPTIDPGPCDWTWSRQNRPCALQGISSCAQTRARTRPFLAGPLWQRTPARAVCWEASGAGLLVLCYAGHSVAAH